MRRILHVIWNLDRGGAETLMTEIYKNIDRKNLQFDFLVYGGHGVFDREVVKLGGKIFYLKKRFSKNIFASLREIYKSPLKYSKEEILSMGKNTPYIGMEMTGFAKYTIVNGKLVWHE